MYASELKAQHHEHLLANTAIKGLCNKNFNYENIIKETVLVGVSISMTHKLE
jgi:hypothetical protein